MLRLIILNPLYAENLSCSPDLSGTDAMKTGTELALVSKKIINCLAVDPCENFKMIINNIKNDHPNFSIDSIKQAFAYKIKYKSIFKDNPNHMMVADYSQNSKNSRSLQIDLSTGKIIARKVSHGRTSNGPKHDGTFKQCKKNGSRTNATRPGFFKMGNTYASIGSCKLKNSSGNPTTFAKMKSKYGVFPKTACGHGEFRDKDGNLKWGWPMLGKPYPSGHNGLRMQGLNKGVNDRAASNGVVMHGAWYNQTDVMGRSYGCPAFHPDEFRGVVDAIKNGGMFYAYTPSCTDDMKSILESVPSWENVCND